jgi:aryl-alcohol dehydrogenase-like predicted oxidoreductase
METVELGGTGVRVSRMALGCMIMGTRTPEDEAFRILDRYVELGGDFLDTANCYAWWLREGSQGGESEELLGRWLGRSRGVRDRVFLATKGSAMVREPAFTADGGPDWSAVRFEGAGAETLRRNLDDSLRRLGTDHVDLYYVHVDDRSTPLEETLGALAELVEAGKTRYIGWSNVHTWRLERIGQLCAQHGWPAPVALQQQYSYLRPRPAEDTSSIVSHEQLDYLREHPDLTLVAYSPILQGLYDDPAKRQGEIMGSFAGSDADARLAVVDKIAAETGARPTQVVLAWLLARPAPRIIPLIGPRTLEQFETAAAALDVTLSEDQLERLDAAAG